jgi:hypothetical protein
MRTKTLLIAAAALAAAVTSANAQSTVYSQNIVGYVNTTFPTAGSSYFLVAPLTGTSEAADILMASALQPGDDILTWNGSGYTLIYYVGPGGNSPNTNVWQDSAFNPTNAPTLAPGEGFFYQNASGSIETNTWVGNVQLTNSISFNVPGASYAVGSTPPVAGAVDNPATINLPLQPGDDTLTWNGSGYTLTYYVGPGGNSPNTNTWQDSAFDPTNAPVVSVGQGFFYQNASGSAETWTQNLVIQ